MIWTPVGEGKKVKHTYAGTVLPPLYERLGGVNSIATVVDAFVDGLLADPAVAGNMRVAESMKKTSPAALKYLVTELTCMVTGGPQKYSGKSMKDSHKDLGITEAEWNAMAKDFVATLTKFNVPAHEQGELLTIVGTTKADVVTVPTMSTMRK